MTIYDAIALTSVAWVVAIILFIVGYAIGSAR